MAKVDEIAGRIEFNLGRKDEIGEALFGETDLTNSGLWKRKTGWSCGMKYRGGNSNQASQQKSFECKDDFG